MKERHTGCFMKERGEMSEKVKIGTMRKRLPLRIGEMRMSFKSLIVILCAAFVLSPAGQPTVAKLEVVTQASGSQPIEEMPPIFDWNATPNQIESWLAKNEQLLASGDGCTLLVSWRAVDSKKYPLGSASHEIVSFIVTPEDDEAHLAIPDKISGAHLSVRLGIKYLPLTPNARELDLAIALEGETQDVFYEDGRTEAMTIRDKNWTMLELVKEIKVSEMAYRYVLHCQNGRTFESYFRKVPKKHK